MARGCKYKTRYWQVYQRDGYRWGRYTRDRTWASCAGLLAATWSAADYITYWIGPNYVHYTLFFN